MKPVVYITAPHKHITSGQLPKKQRGVAIITALLIVAIATAISADISTRLQLDARRTGNIIASEQSALYTLAAEDWSRRILRDDREDNNYDHLKENWATEIPPLPVEGGYIKGKLKDLQACINVNSLYAGGVVNILAKERMERLLANLELDATLTQSIIDWIDIDQQTIIPNGAEDGYYTALEKPYRAANTPMRSSSELRLVRGFENSETYNALKDLVCAFGIATSININTAPEEVLSSLANGIDSASIIEERDDIEGFKDINKFLAFKNLKKLIKKTDGLAVSTSYFLLETESVIGQSRTIMFSVIHRDADGKTKVIARSQGAY